MANKNLTASLSLIALPFLLSGCTNPEFAKFFNEKISPHVGWKMELNTTEAKPAKDPNAAAESETPTDSNKHVNAEFLRELFKVVLNREIESQEEFIKYMNVLDQGGHYEGIYNGLVYSEEYKAKEKGAAPIGALKAYAELMTQLTLDQKYDPLKINQPAADGLGAKRDDSNLAPPQPTDAERQAFIQQFESDGLAKSLFTLKRRIGEEALKTIDLKKEYKEKLATWYARFAVMLNKKGVDFGIPQRNSADEYFHYKWALDTDEDRLKWETLNRAHVLLNSQSK